ncbi:M20/M25/M40 family metallo-hydrolase [Marinobacter salinisoli]|uniref:M20/M25/M40 family metallo-hydrolase n=1 Tax=Marinobacter salinisoli TaxID=2769486 RepID=A0ABX7MX49_9GAMM|nr:M20/M25/M40 family metallo-hydrolase [Marinobacter salinisoli]QSP94773.1 M20/M25/M40 family metallo-hydrolase [Marinobacter salinisoli]
MQNKPYTYISSLTLVVAGAASLPASAAVGPETYILREAVTLESVRSHQAEFQAIADANGGTREASSPGYQASVDYVASQMAAAGYEVTIQEFDFPFFEENIPATLEQIAPSPKLYDYFGVPNGFATMSYSGSGDVTAIAEGVDLVLPPAPDANTSTSGCEAEDFAGFTAGNIAVIQRGSCSFAQKATNAENAGAVGVIIFNEGQPGRTDNFLGTLGGPGFTVPVVGASFEVGTELAAGGVAARMLVDAASEIRTTSNVIAESTEGRDDRVVVVGAHLDSVAEGPGIQDNGSGSAAILETAIQLASLGITPRNKLRFAWWGAEEAGLLGAEFYVANLSDRDIKNIALNLNFDMIGSPNFVRFVYDGDGSDTPQAGPNGSKVIESVFLKYFSEVGLPVEPTAFDGRSDYGPFIAVGIPAGGLFTGAEGIKTPDEAALYGGTAGDQYDPCYHLACDTFDNISLEALDQMSDAVAHAVLTFAMTTSSVNGTDKGKGLGKFKNDMEYKGNKLVK